MTEDIVNHPKHYTQGNIEVIDFIKDMPCREANIIKYVCRYKFKNGLEDLKKAKWYLGHIIEELESDIT